MNIELPKYVGLNEMVDELARKLMLTRFQNSRLNQSILMDDVTKTCEEYLGQRLTTLGVPHKVWRDVAEPYAEGIRPVFVFGNTFIPDLVIDVAEKPTLALSVKYIGPGARTTFNLSAAIGEALVFSHQYPAVIAFLYQSKKGVDYMHLLDREIMMALWHEHKIKLVLR